jgi:hypothetical protein
LKLREARSTDSGVMMMMIYEPAARAGAAQPDA